MEEASVAGESPDRSKQHESSVEPTSGSTSGGTAPVPVPDPRLAVAREAVTAAARVDTATAVFSTKRYAKRSEGSAGSVAAEASSGSDGSPEPESAETGAAKGAEGGDGRLRDAVAAWVAGADEEAPEGASGGAGADSGAPDASDASEGDVGAAEEISDVSAADAAHADERSDGATVEDVSEAGGSGGPGADSVRGDDGDGGSGGDVEAGDGDGAEASAEVGGERNAEVAEVASADADIADDGDSEPEAGASSVAEGGSDADTDSDSGPGSELGNGAPPEAETQTEAEAETDGDADSEPDADADAAADRDSLDDVDDDADTDSEPEDAASAKAPAEDDASADVAPDGTSSDAAVDRTRTADGDDAEDSADDRPVADAEPADSADSADSADAEREPADEPHDEPHDEPRGGADAEPGAETADSEGEASGGADVDQDADADAGSAAESGEAIPKPRVDQPTATFKVRPPAVDQPTAMLKLGGARPKTGPDADSGAESDKDSAPKPGGKSGGKAAPEAPSERTSKFVALKPLDEPAPPKPRPAAPPTVPPAAETAAVPQVGPERTAQQPLPPKPPLDLLAELTNTPPPRQTPVRTVVRRVKIWTPLVLLLAVVFAVVQAVRPLPTPTLTLTADESYAFEGQKVSLPWPDEGQGWMDVNGIGTVDDFGEQRPVAIGSVAKAMTAYLILKNHPMKAGEEGKQIPVDAKAETEGGYDEQNESTLNTVKEGDTLTEKQALAAIMIPSANNIARLLARWDSDGSEKAFVKKMNDAAKDLGMNDTTYTDPSGLKETTVSTAEDQVKLGNELVKMKALTDITRLPEWIDPSGKKWRNWNDLVPYNDAIGIKTGSTTKAGGNLLFAATKEVGGETVTVVGAILGQHKPPIIDTANAVSRTAMVAAQDVLTSRTILKKGDVVGYVDDGFGGQTPVVATKDVSAVGWAGKTVKLNLSEDGTTIPNEAKAGTKVGSLSVGDGTGDAVEVPVALRSDLTEPGYGAKLTRIG
ncbi:D-alanyl-D-alanine carboxypeptidase [Streptomyces sp. 2A115]|uniref:D-alanyl-D-alanine carboxypeptidase n=1 Tax=Streptomyces sp. 2A115 TaxID=3457439 RepID=UPI003FD58D8A